MNALLELIPLPVRLIALAVIAAALAWGGWHARGIYEAAQERDALVSRLDKIGEKVDAATKAGDEAAKAIGGIKVVNRTITNEVRHETQTKEVFRDAHCDLPDSTRRLLDAILEGRKPGANPGESPGRVPAVVGAAQ
ncbi:hypothetical protein UFOVP1040_60 [uncultured Caudovirales phage]|uniref:Uncharacterized protein n=1 Tax=uncultured Caudovirales phage TaxID=2100421 RepID=A0A6J5QDT2_9CAUD|nr:hypothetical protein UFOVP1040_60 [uncultured Caudovirales phage]